MLFWISYFDYYLVCLLFEIHTRTWTLVYAPQQSR